MDQNDIIIVEDSSTSIMPVVDMHIMADRQRAILQMVKENILVEKEDYGIIPGTNDKKVLLKGGAEKLIAFFGLAPHFETLNETIDFSGEEPFFFFRYRCVLMTRDGRFKAGEGIGSCNSHEKKYRYRLNKLTCPTCGEELRRSKKDPEYYCWQKTGGCGLTFSLDHPDIVNQPVGYVPNPDIADTVNTIDKMAQKRAMVAATLVAVGASSMFTQDLEDMPGFGVEVVEAVTQPEPEPEPTTQPAQPQQAASTAPAQPDHPWAAEYLREVVQKTAEDRKRTQAGPSSLPQQKLLAMQLKDACKSDDERYMVQDYLFGRIVQTAKDGKMVRSSAGLSKAEISVLIDWSGKVEPDALRYEVEGIIYAYQRENGQTDMFDDNPGAEDNTAYGAYVTEG